MNEEDNRPILNLLFKQSTLPEFCCRLRWTAGAVAIWDNYSTQHYAINDYHGFRREMRRTTFRSRTISVWRGNKAGRIDSVGRSAA